MDDMNDFESLAMTTLDAMNNLKLWLTWMTLGCEFKALDAIHNLRLWTIQGYGWQEWLWVLSLKL